VAATDFDFSLTRTQIIEGALRKLGALGFGDTLSGEESVNAVTQLNALVKEWQTKDIFLWQLKVQTLTTTGAVAATALPTDPGILGVDSAAWVNGTAHEPVEVISWRTYQAIATKADAGDPVYLTLDNARAGSVYCWPVPATAKTLRLVVISKLKDWDTAAGNGDFPEHWMLALQYGLADLLADDYGIPATERDRLAQKAQFYFTRAKGSNRDRQDRTTVKGAYE
jgi:hypothetical protein